MSAVVALVFLAMAMAVVLRPDGQSVKEMGMNRTTTSGDGTTIAYTQLGSGPSLILVDGAFCYRENGHASQLAPLLAKHFTVFAYDRRGLGESGDAPGNAIEREVGDLRALVRVAGGSAFAVGISSGGALALQAVAEGVSFNRLALYEPPFIEEDGHAASLETRKRRLEEFVSADDRAGAVRFFMTDVYDAPKPFVALMPLIMRSAWRKNQSVAHTLPYDLTLMEDWSVLRDRSRLVTVPTLVIGERRVQLP